MNTELFYFTGTGNTLAIARDLARELGGAQLVSIPAALKTGPMTEAERVGILFPVYMFGLPVIVAEFCRRLNAGRAEYLFGLANFGGMPGNALGQMKGIFAGRNMPFAAGYGVAMPGNYTPLYGAPPEAAQRRMFDAEAAEVRRIAGRIRADDRQTLVRSGFLANAILHGIFYRLNAKRICRMDARFRATSACTKCGICRRVCPVGNIELKEGRPMWLHRCEQCMACLQWCPAEAIEFGRSTKGRRRYRHPGATVEDLAAHAGAEAGLRHGG